MMNSTAVPSKRSKVERQLDYLIIAIFAMLFAICLVGSVGGALWVDSAHWYLDLAAEGEASSSRAMFDPDNRGTVGLLAFMTLLTLYSSIIPISLYVSIEIIKYVQAGTFINQDIEMYDLESDTPALARTSNLVRAAPCAANEVACLVVPKPQPQPFFVLSSITRHTALHTDSQNGHRWAYNGSPVTLQHPYICLSPSTCTGADAQMHDSPYFMPKIGLACSL